MQRAFHGVQNMYFDSYFEDLDHIKDSIGV